jgi:spore maturation protein CgeB
VPFPQIVDAEKPSQSILDEVRNAAQAYMATTPKQIENPNQTLDYFLYVVSNYSYRRRVIECLLPLGLRVFGPKSWLTVLSAEYRNRYGGSVPFENAADAYASADLCLNLHSFQCPTCLNSRDFDVVMAGGCLLADWVEDYDRGFFAPELEVALFRSDEELLEKAQSLLSDPDRRESMKAAARQRLLAEHTYAHRADVIIRALGSRRGDTFGGS